MFHGINTPSYKIHPATAALHPLLKITDKHKKLKYSAKHDSAFQKK